MRQKAPAKRDDPHIIELRLAGQIYERFLEGPELVVLVVLWLAGVVLLAACAAALYFVGSFVMRMVLAGG